MLIIHADIPIDLFPVELLKRVETDYGEDAKERIEDWQALVKDAGGDSEKEQLTRVNRFFNRVRFVDDMRVWQQEDYWATPVEFLGRNAGDCEDFTIAKYFTLRALGVPAEKLRLMYVRALRINQSHMVLAYFESPDAMPLVLDNINKKILPANYRKDLKPIYSFNADGLWAAKAQGRGRKIKEKGSHSSWQDIITRIEHGQ
ncbi:transglutaminase-like cysteine peptidase [Thalassotalea atypica]|uniref:transglutaminase-like cysteine peptidase n=1 Tax=Thalassotalea atypica TaxID=2054316 RepID=UPI002573F77D|nr:transglutaminase-like cysteine peptidase [Thalassotalea atypica]